MAFLEGEIRRVKEGEFPGVSRCLECGNFPNSIIVYGDRHFQCCDSSWEDVTGWNLHLKGKIKVIMGEPTPEEDEAFHELDQKLNPEPDYADTPFAVRGRILERMGKLMQDKSATVHDLAKVAAEARMSVYFKIQPEVVVTTYEK